MIRCAAENMSCAINCKTFLGASEMHVTYFHWIRCVGRCIGRCLTRISIQFEWNWRILATHPKHLQNACIKRQLKPQCHRKFIVVTCHPIEISIYSADICGFNHMESDSIVFIATWNYWGGRVACSNLFPILERNRIQLVFLSPKHENRRKKITFEFQFWTSDRGFFLLFSVPHSLIRLNWFFLFFNWMEFPSSLAFQSNL